MNPFLWSLLFALTFSTLSLNAVSKSLDSTGRMPLTEGLSFTVTAVEPDLAPGETNSPDGYKLVLTSRQGARVSWGGNLNAVLAPGEIEVVTITLGGFPAIFLQGDRPFSVYSFQDLLGNGEQAWHLPRYAWDTAYRPFEWWQDSYSVVGGPKTTATGRMVIIAGRATTVEIKRAGGSETFAMVQGETRVITEDTVANGTRNISSDPTGFEVVSDEPIAIISGHAKGAVLRFPDGLPGTGEYARPASRSRGNMHEAMLPSSYAGTMFVTAPLLYTPTRIRGWDLDKVGIEDDKGDVIRFVALHDSTVIRSVSDVVADHVDTVMDAGDTWYASRVEYATVWTSNKPVLCMQYGKSFGRIISQATEPDQDPSVDAGLPMMQVVPSVKQWVDHALFMAHDETTNFLNVVCSVDDASKITVNGRPLTSSLRRHTISDQPYVCYSGMIEEGPYTVTSTHPQTRFCAWTYGSLDGLQLCKIYGSVAGMNMAIECNDSVIVEQRTSNDSIIYTFSVVDDGGGCGELAYACAERCDGGQVKNYGNSIEISRTSPTSMVDGNIIVVSRSGRYVRRWFHLDGTTTVSEQPVSSFSISPQPINDLLIIRRSSASALPNQLSIYTVTGNLVIERTIGSEEIISLDCTDLNTGVYLLCIGNERTMISVQ